MKTFAEINCKGRAVRVPCVKIGDNKVVVNGRWLRTAFVYDEGWLPGQVVADAQPIIRRIREAKLGADVLTFGQKLPDTEPKFSYHFEWDNVAAIRLTSFDEWWKQLPQVTRKNVRRSGRRGVVVRCVALDEDLVRGIVDVYKADPIRQGVPNVHYSKSLETLQKEVSTFPKVSQFIGAYLRDELIGYIKLVDLGPIVSIMNIVCKNAHQDKRPANALITKAVEVCCDAGKQFIVYGKYGYGNKTNSPLAEFKRRNGFEQINLPQYFVPLTVRGKLGMALGLHRGLLGILPSGLIDFLLEVRRRVYSFRAGKASLLESKELADPVEAT